MNWKLLSCIAILLTAELHAQTPADALRLSYQTLGGGTARSIGVGSAIGALGADYTAVGINPAGLASYRTSEIVFSPGLSQVRTNSELKDQAVKNTARSDQSTKFFIGNLALVGCIKPAKGNWLLHNWTIGFNRVNTYNGSYYFNGESRGSIVNRFLEKANKGGSLNPFEEELAKETGAIYRRDATVPYSSDFDGYNDVPISKSQQGETTGRVNEMTFGYAANYREKLQIGAVLGVPFFRFSDNRIYRETDTETATDLGKIPSFKELKFWENYNVSGRGINARIGIIYKPVYAVRLGLAAHTPTRFFLDEAYNNSFNYQYLDEISSGGLIEGNETSRSPQGVFDYKINTPWRFTASSSYLIGKRGFISADADILNYARMNFEYGIEDKDAQQSLNADIRRDYRTAVNLRLGAEWVYDIFRFRTGIATLGLPSKSPNSGYFEEASKMYSFGAGIRENRFYFDLAYQFVRTSDVFSPYQVSSDYASTVVTRTRNNSLIAATMGFKF